MTNPYLHLAVMLAMLALATWIMWKTMRDAITTSIIDATRWRMIDRLRQGGVAVSISLHQPNEYSQTGDDQEAITVNADWTNWHDQQYQAATVDIALAQAINDMDRAS